MHFVVLGAAIFAVFAVLAPPQVSSEAITITDADVETITEQFKQSWRSEPTSSEMAALIENLVREEVFYREALRLGLDRGDTVIRQRIRQKLEFILTAAQQAGTPSEDELQAWFDAHPDDYAASPTLQFAQVLLESQADAITVLKALEAGVDPAAVGKATQLPPTVLAVSSAIDASFGPGFSAALETLPPGLWTGPVESSYGLHLVKIVSVVREPTDFEARRAEVLADWMRDAAQRHLDETYAAMRKDYVVQLPDSVAK